MFRCGACKYIIPHIEKLSKDSSALFVKLDADQSPVLFKKNQIGSYPTFHFLVKGKKVAEVVGADIGEIQRQLKTVQKLFS